MAGMATNKAREEMAKELGVYPEKIFRATVSSMPVTYSSIYRSATTPRNVILFVSTTVRV
eukprot:SAG31_NODE_3609_length_4070_cov_2.814153_5_plen_60_part_00